MTVPRRRLAALLALVAVAAGAVVFAVRYADSSPPAVPAGGSSYGSGPPPRVLQRLRDVRVPSGRSGARLAPVPRIPLERGAAQLFVVGFAGDAPRAPFFTDLTRRDWGGVLLTRANAPTPEAVPTLAGEAVVVARNAGHLPPLVVAAGDLPGMPQTGPARPDTARRRAALAARALRPAGVTMALAPSADIGSVGGPYAQTAFGDEPVPVARAVRAAVDGWRGGGVAPVVGAYPGTGAASADPDSEVATVGLSLPELRAGELRVFRAVRARTPVIQMSSALYAAYDGVTPATLLPDVVAALRAEGFRGVVMSASLPSATLATGGSVADAAVDALRAGCDLLLVPGDRADQEAAYRAVVRAVRSGVVPMQRYRDALARVAALKRAYRAGQAVQVR